MSDADIPEDVARWIGTAQIVSESAVPVETGAIEAFAAAVEDANPLYWDEEAARRIAGGRVSPLAMLSAWTRPNRWSPPDRPVERPLELHFRVKERLGFPNALVADASTLFLEPARPGDRIRAEQVLADVGPVVENRLGRGRYWTILVHYRRADAMLLGTETLTFFGYGKAL